MLRDSTRSHVAWAVILGLLCGCQVATSRPLSGTPSTLNTLIIGDPSYDARGSDQLAMGVNLAIRDLNSGYTDPVTNLPILPDVRLAADRYDSNLSAPGTTYREFLALAKLQKYSIWAGPLSSELTTASSLFASYKSILSFSPTANATEFSDKSQYGYFWRYVDPVENLAEPAIALIRQFNWTDVVLTWVEGTEGATVSDIFSSIAMSVNVTMVAKVPFSISDEKDLYMQVLGPLKFIRSTKARVIVLAGGPSASLDIMLAANRLGMVGNGYVWITLQTQFAPNYARQRAYWGSEFSPSVLRGVTQLSMPRGPYAQDPVFQTFKTKFDAYASLIASGTDASFYRSLSTNTSSPNHPRNAFYDDPGTNTIPAFNVLAGYDGIMTAAIAMEKRLQESNANGNTLTLSTGINFAATLLENITAVTYHGVTGISTFKPVGDPGMPYELKLLKGDVWPSPTNAAAAMSLVGTISVPASGVLDAVVTLTLSSYFWNDGRVASVFVPPQYPVLVEEFIPWDTADTKAILGLHIVFWAVLVATLLVLIVKAASPEVKRASPNFMGLLTVGLMIASLNVLTLPGKTKDLGCLLRPWPLSIGLCIVLTTILAKVYHIYYVFDNIDLYQLPTLLFNSPKLYAVVTAVVVANSAILISYTAKAPLRSSFVLDEQLNKRTYACLTAPETASTTNGLIWFAIIFDLLLLASTILFAYWTRNAPSHISNAKQLGYVVYVTALLTLIVMVGGFSGVSTIKTQFFIESIVILFGLVTMYAFLVAAPLIAAMTGYVSNQLPSISSFAGSSGAGASKDSSTSMGTMSTTSHAPDASVAATGRGRSAKTGPVKLVFSDADKDPSASLETLFEPINGTFHLREAYMQCTTHIVPTWTPVTVTLIFESLNLLLCVSTTDDTTTEFNLASLHHVRVHEHHPTEPTMTNCLTLKQAKNNYVLQFKTLAHAIVLGTEVAKCMMTNDDDRRERLKELAESPKAFNGAAAGAGGGKGKTAAPSGGRRVKTAMDDDD
ncbi:periplasmic binding protein-like I [Entophlyctis helioformis]|nr:periplasmic binding protein-like I [Entophlyctis helioformis]